MKVKMLQTAPGSPDGIQVLEYEEGETYDVPVDLAQVLVDEDLAEALEELPETPKPETDIPPATPAGGSPAPETLETPAAVDYSTLKQAQLKALLEERKIEFPDRPGVANKVLVALLEAADADAAVAPE